MSFHIKAALLRASSGINQGVGGASNDLHVDALAVLDVHGGSAVYRRGVGERQTVQFNGGFVAARHVELAVGRRAAQFVGDFCGEGVALRNGDMSPLLGDGQILADVVGHIYCRRCAVINHFYSVVVLCLRKAKCCESKQNE